MLQWDNRDHGIKTSDAHSDKECRAGRACNQQTGEECAACYPSAWPWAHTTAIKSIKTVTYMNNCAVAHSDKQHATGPMHPAATIADKRASLQDRSGQVEGMAGVNTCEELKRAQDERTG